MIQQIGLHNNRQALCDGDNEKNDHLEWDWEEQTVASQFT